MSRRFKAGKTGKAGKVLKIMGAKGDGKVGSFEDLEVWQEGCDLAVLIYGAPSPQPGMLTPAAAMLNPYETVSKIAKATSTFLPNSIS